MTRRRNPLGRLAILGKGGPHVRSKSGQRAAKQRELDAAIDEWKADQAAANGVGIDGNIDPDAGVSPHRIGFQ